MRVLPSVAPPGTLMGSVCGPAELVETANTYTSPASFNTRFWFQSMNTHT
ncbi:MAG: hypothetical protein IPG69_02965 [Flavobacteriales bacterium]|nr:hypothetical protein [Flavobacteriales bacterium]